MRKHYPLNSNGAEDAGKLPWTDGVPSTGVEGSYPGQALVTDSEAEILSAIDGAGFLRNGSDLTQLLQAIARGLWLGQFGGTAAALVATVPNNLVIPSLQSGVRVRGIAASNYPGGGGTLAITGVGPLSTSVMTCPIVGSDGVTALAAGAWKAGQFLTFEIDASGNARFGGAATVTAAAVNPIIKQYLSGLPPVQTVFIDAVNGSESNDGSTIALARKDIDAVLDTIGTTATQIFLLSDVTIRRRRNVYASLNFQGIVASGAAAGYTPTYRNITFLGTADNSPSAAVGTFSSGLFLLNTNLAFSYINCIVADAVSGQNYIAHITSNSGTNIILGNFGVLVQSTNAGSVFGSTSTPIDVFGSVNFGTNAPGHLFEGIAAGGNPNSAYRYRTNITSA